MPRRMAMICTLILVTFTFGEAFAEVGLSIRRKCRTFSKRYVARSLVGCIGFPLPLCYRSSRSCTANVTAYCPWRSCIWGGGVAYSSITYRGWRLWASRRGQGLAGPKGTVTQDRVEAALSAPDTRGLSTSVAPSAAPDPGQSSVTPYDTYGHALMSPGATGGVDAVTVAVRDGAGLPVVGALVELNLLADCDDFGICVDDTDSGLRGITDASGNVTLNPSVGGCGPCSVDLVANGVVLRTYTEIRSPDYDGVDGDGVVGAGDFAWFQTVLGGTDPCADYDGNGLVNTADFALFNSAFGDANTGNCAATEWCCLSSGLCVEVQEGLCDSLGGAIVVECASCVEPASNFSHGVFDGAEPAFDDPSETVTWPVEGGRFLASNDSAGVQLDLRAWAATDSTDTTWTPAKTFWSGTLRIDRGVVTYGGSLNASHFVTGGDAARTWADLKPTTFLIPFSPPQGTESFDDVVVEVVVDPDGIAGISAADADHSPTAFALGNHPNPLRSRTTISYDLQAGGLVSLDVYDVAGRHVRTLVPRTLEASGRHVVTWDTRTNHGGRVAPGIYFYRLDVDGVRTTRRMLVLP